MRGLKPFLLLATFVLALLAAKHWNEIIAEIRSWNLGPFIEGMFRR